MSVQQQAAYAEVLQKIGRNLLLFQQAEGLVKRLVTLGTLSTHAGEGVREFEQRASFCHKMTMGQVVNLFLDRISASQAPIADSPPAAPPAPHCGSLSISFHLHLDIGADPEERRLSFARMKEQRNDLVHHLFSRIDPDSPESCASISNELDEQRRQILPEVQRLQQDLRNARADLKKLVEFLDAPEAQVELCLPEIQQSPLIRNLATLAAESTEPGGWIQFGEATKQLKDFPREKIRAHLNQFQLASLTDFLTASRLFEIRAQPSESGHDRMFYRLKSAPTALTATDSAEPPPTIQLPVI